MERSRILFLCTLFIDVLLGLTIKQIPELVAVVVGDDVVLTVGNMITAIDPLRYNGSMAWNHRIYYQFTAFAEIVHQLSRLLGVFQGAHWGMGLKLNLLWNYSFHFSYNGAIL